MCGGVGSITKGGSNVNPCVKAKLKRPLLGCRGLAPVANGLDAGRIRAVRELASRHSRSTLRSEADRLTLLVPAALELRGGPVAQRRMAPPEIVETFQKRKISLRTCSWVVNRMETSRSQFDRFLDLENEGVGQDSRVWNKFLPGD